MKSPQADQSDSPTKRVLLRCGGALDGGGVAEVGAQILLERSGPTGWAVLARGAEAEQRGGSEALVVDRPDRLAIPALVNAHAHLDLTHIGPRPFDREAGFVPWVDVIREERARDEASITASVAEGARRAIAGGTAAIGDIAGDDFTVAHRALTESGLWGVSFAEFFGLGLRQADTIQRMARAVADADASRACHPRVRFGLQPHAPYSAGPDVYRAARGHALDGVPVTTHLAETPEELMFVAAGSGPQRALLERLGAWDDSILNGVGMGRTPVAHAEEHLGRCSPLVAHCNALRDADIDELVRMGATVAYCPRCSDYFGRREDFGPHRYRDLLEAGVPVALGTDSVINLSDSGARRLSILDEMSHLALRDAADPRLLLRMATTHGARGLGLDPAWVTLEPGPVLGVLLIEVPETALRALDAEEMLAGALRGRAGLEWLVGEPGVVEEFGPPSR